MTGAVMTKPQKAILVAFTIFLALLNIALYFWNQSPKAFEISYLRGVPVDTITIDKQGRVLVYGAGKLSIYKDGELIQIFTQEDSPALGGDHLWILEVDNNGKIWVAPHGYERTVDLASFDGKNWSTLLPSPGSEPLDWMIGVSNIAFDPQGRTWISTGIGEDGLYIIDGNVWEKITSDKSGLTSDGVGYINFDNQGHAWIGSGGSLNMFDGKVWKTYSPENSPLLDGGIRAIAFDQKGQAWIASGQPFGTDKGGGISVFDGKNWIIYPDMSTTGFDDIEVDGLGRVWALSTSEYTLFVFDGETWKKKRFSGNNREYVHANLLTDKEGNIWISTQKNGATFYPVDPQKYFSPLDHKLNQLIASHTLIYLDIILIGILLYFPLNPWRMAGLNLANLLKYFTSKKETEIRTIAMEEMKSNIFTNSEAIKLGIKIGIIPLVFTYIYASMAFSSLVSGLYYGIYFVLIWGTATGIPGGIIGALIGRVWKNSRHASQIGSVIGTILGILLWHLLIKLFGIEFGSPT